jgi:ABC-type lipoprotein export system ATPase subunit
MSDANENRAPTSSRSERALIETVGVRRIYQKSGHSLAALDGVSVRFRQSTFTAIVGRSGSGKSTLLNLIGCLDLPSEGQVLVDGTDTKSLDDRAASRLRNRLTGFLFQSFNLIPQMNVVENIETALLYSDRPRGEWRERAYALLDRLGIRGRAEHRPSELSGGEAQRAALARALVNDPEILLADEPTGNLDSRTGEEVLALLEELVADGRTLVLVTHDPAIARRADRVIELSDGRLVADTESGSESGSGSGGSSRLGNP